MPIGLVAAGVGAAGAIGGAIISGNAAKDAANTSAAAAGSAQAEQAREFAASQAALQTGAANANVVQGQQHDATVGLQQQTASDVTGLQGSLYNSSLDTINQGYKSALDANNPYLTTGTDALNRLAGLYGLSTVDASGNTVSGGSGSVDPNASFYQTPDYQFQLSQGIKGVDTGAAARGMLDSGATRKAEIAYAGNLAAGQYTNYAARLASLAGIGQNAVTTNAAGTTNYVNAVTGANQNYGNNYATAKTGAANQIGAANQAYATQYGNAQLGLGSDIANASTAYGNNYAASVTNAGNTQANASLAQGSSYASGINGLAGTTAQYLNNNPNLFGSSYTTPPGQTSGAAMGWT